MARWRYGRSSKTITGSVRSLLYDHPFRSMKTLAAWILFIAPLQRVLYLRHDKGGPLGGCLLCVSGDGTIAVIALDNYSL
jgi:hypothetical protein